MSEYKGGFRSPLLPLNKLNLNWSISEVQQLQESWKVRGFYAFLMYFRFRVDFPRERTVAATLSPLTTTLRERGRRGAVYIVSRPQIYSHPAAPPRAQLLPLKTVSVRLSAPNWRFTHSHDFDAQVNLLHLNAPRSELSEGKKSVHFTLPSSLFFLNCWTQSRFVRVMSRKKAAKGKGSSKSPKASPSSGRTGKGLTAAAAPSSGLVYPSRPSISNSGEFYDISFKVSWSDFTCKIKRESAANLNPPPPHFKKCGVSY